MPPHKDTPRCGAPLNKPLGGFCKNVAGARTDHHYVGRCYMHDEADKRSKAEIARAARQLAQRYGEPVQINAEEAIDHLMAESYGRILWLKFEIERLGHPVDDDLELRHKVETAQGEEWLPSTDVILSSLYGPEYHASGKVSGETVVHVLVRLYDEERDRLAKTAEIALKHDTRQRALKLKEAQARIILEAAGRALAQLEMGEKTDDFKYHFSRALAELTTPEAPRRGPKPGYRPPALVSGQTSEPRETAF